jgi:hypothetical protein
MAKHLTHSVEFKRQVSEEYLSAPETHINGIPFAVALVHIAPRATDAHDVKHAIEE